MHWNHRVMRTRDDDGDYSYQIHEVYYFTDNEVETVGTSIMHTDPVEPFGETVDELRRDLWHMLAALKLPVIDVETLEEL